MDLRTAAGFLGTEASLSSDLSLVAYVLLIIPGMLAGSFLAHRRNFFYHQWLMTGITIFNWVLIIFLMWVSYSRGVAPRVATNFARPGVWLPKLHLLTGLSAQLLATYLVIQMWIGPNMRFPLMPFKRWMRFTLVLWLFTALAGVAIYLTWFGLPFVGNSG